MAWFDRPEGFTVKSFDNAAPTIALANEIRAHADVLPKRCDCDCGCRRPHTNAAQCNQCWMDCFDLMVPTDEDE